LNQIENPNGQSVAAAGGRPGLRPAGAPDAAGSGAPVAGNVAGGASGSFAMNGGPQGFRVDGASAGARVGRGDGNPNAPRPAMVTVVKDDGTQEARQIMVGVTSRVAAEVISGLAVGEKVIAGILEPEGTAAAGNNQNNNGGFRGPGMPFPRF
jgi:hypothetical protein